MADQKAYEPDGNFARDQLSAAALGGSAGAVISQTAGQTARVFASVIGILIAAYLLVVLYVYPTRIPWLIALTTAAYFVGIAAAVLWFQRRRQASTRGWNMHYLVGLALSITLYCAGIFMFGIVDFHALWFWLPYAGVTALPLVVAGTWRGNR